jgi:hypothetical protein
MMMMTIIIIIMSTTSLYCGHQLLIPQVIYEHGEPWGSDVGSSFAHQSTIWKSYQQMHLVENQADMGEGNDGFCL